MAPEQVRCEAVTAATDVFSLGCMLYEMISGRRGFQRSSPASTLIAILTEESVPVVGAVQTFHASSIAGSVIASRRIRAGGLSPHGTWR